jgi:hypothetical protein
MLSFDPGMPESSPCKPRAGPRHGRHAWSFSRRSDRPIRPSPSSPWRAASSCCLPMAGEGLQVSPCLILTPLGFQPCVPPPEVGDDTGPSILTRSDGPSGSIPLRPPVPLTGRARLSVHPGSPPTLSWPEMGRPGANRPRFV